MKHNKLFSLSLQKQIGQYEFSMENEINKALNELNIRSLLRKAGIVKEKGYAAVSLFFLIILLPFFKQYLSWLYSPKCFLDQINARKDTYYRFLNNERFNWRRLVYLIVMKVVSHSNDVPLKQKTLIADDTIAIKTGKNMEMVSYHFDHKTGRSELGYQFLHLGYHNGINFFPVDMSVYTSSKRPNTRMRDIDKRTNGFKRRKEAVKKKTDVLVEMISRAWQNGFDASFVLFDSWFSHDRVISEIIKIGYGVICRLKKGRVRYEYDGQSYTLVQLWKKVRKKTRQIPEFGLKGICLNVVLPNSGYVRIAFISDGKKQWHAFLCSDIESDLHEILSYYSRRWAIEVFFKDTKQMLYLGKEQSNTFDAVISCHSLVMIRYLLLIYILNKYQLTGPIGPLFRDISDSQLILHIAEQMWSRVKELLIKSSDIICHKIEPDLFFYIIDIIEEALLKQTQIATKLTAKL